MRCTFAVLLFLSLPAYSAIIETPGGWHLNGTAGNGTMSGSFDTALTNWNIELNFPGSIPLELFPICTPNIPPATGCEPPRGWAEKLSPTHLKFHWDESPARTMLLDLSLSSPLGAENNQVTGEFVWDYFQRHELVKGVLAAPEPNVIWFLLVIALASKVYCEKQKSDVI